MTALSWVRLWFWQLITRLSYFSPFSSPEPVVSWSRGRETRVGHTGRLEIKPSGSGDENDFPRCFVQNKELLFSSVVEPLHDHGHIFAWPIFSRPLPFLQCQKVVTLCFHLPPPPLLISDKSLINLSFSRFGIHRCLATSHKQILKTPLSMTSSCILGFQATWQPTLQPTCAHFILPRPQGLGAFQYGGGNLESIFIIKNPNDFGKREETGVDPCLPNSSHVESWHVWLWK